MKVSNLALRVIAFTSGLQLQDMNEQFKWLCLFQQMTNTYPTFKIGANGAFVRDEKARMWPKNNEQTRKSSIGVLRQPVQLSSK